jgi:hypothetical protein
MARCCDGDPQWGPQQIDLPLAAALVLSDSRGFSPELLEQPPDLLSMILAEFSGWYFAH